MSAAPSSPGGTPSPDAAPPATRPHVRVVRGAPDDVELAALVAGLVAAASEAGTLLGSMGHGHANPAAVKNAMYDVITAHFNGEYDSRQAAEELVNAVEGAQ